MSGSSWGWQGRSGAHRRRHAARKHKQTASASWLAEWRQIRQKLMYKQAGMQLHPAAMAHAQSHAQSDWQMLHSSKELLGSQANRLLLPYFKKSIPPWGPLLRADSCRLAGARTPELRPLPPQRVYVKSCLGIYPNVYGVSWTLRLPCELTHVPKQVPNKKQKLKKA